MINCIRWLEAARLTRAGQLIEATEFLQRLLRGETPGPASGTFRDTVNAPDAGASGIVEVRPRTAGAQGPQPSGRKTWTWRRSTGRAEGAAQPQMPEVLRSLPRAGQPDRSGDGNSWAAGAISGASA